MKRVRLTIGAHNSCLMGLLFLLELTTSISLSVTLFAKNVCHQFNDKTAAYFNVVIFATSAAVYLLISLISIPCYANLCAKGEDQNKQEEEAKKKEPWGCKELFGSLFITTLGGLFYFIGDNMPPIFNEFADQLRCDETCLSYIKECSEFLMNLAAVSFFLPESFVKIKSKSKLKENQGERNKYAKNFKFFSKQLIRFDLLLTVTESILYEMESPNVTNLITEVLPNGSNVTIFCNATNGSLIYATDETSMYMSGSASSGSICAISMILYGLYILVMSVLTFCNSCCTNKKVSNKIRSHGMCCACCISCK